MIPGTMARRVIAWSEPDTPRAVHAGWLTHTRSAIVDDTRFELVTMEPDIASPSALRQYPWYRIVLWELHDGHPERRSIVLLAINLDQATFEHRVARVLADPHAERVLGVL